MGETAEEVSTTPRSGRLPGPRTPGRYAVGLVCLGNICRSPMADVLLTDAVRHAGLADRVDVASCGTGPWHVGEPMDARAAATLREAGHDPAAHRGRQIDADWFGRDLLLAMDRGNLRDVLALDPPEPDRVRMFRDLDPADPGADVPDPYYGGERGFADVLGTVQRVADTLVDQLRSVLDAA